MIEVTTEIGTSDHRAFTRYVWYSGARGSWLWFVLIFIAVVAISVLLEAQAGVHLHSPTMLVTMFILTGYLALAQRRIRPHSDGASLGVRTFALSAEGLHERSRNYEMLTRWDGVVEVDETPEHVFVFIDNCQAHIIPKRSFVDADHCKSFTDELKRRVAREPERQLERAPLPASGIS